MAQDFGSGVSRTLSALERQFLQTVWQASKPPLDSELNLVAQISSEALRYAVRSEMHSGFLLDPMLSESDFQTNSAWSNWFKFGRPASESATAPFMWANVNGWLIPVSGSGVVDGDPGNRINLFGPPATDARIDFVFLEVWQAQVAPNPSTANKPSASSIYKYGNVEFGGTNIADDIQDPTIGFETTERVQLQYRLRVVGSGTGLGDSIDLAQYPDGLDDPNVIAQGTQAAPVAGYPFSNMGDTLGDRGLWRAGAGDSTSRTALGTVDGYVYAIPVCAVFRRNAALFVARTNAGNANQNGSFNRNPTTGAITDPLQATRTFTSVTLAADVSASATGLVSVAGLAGSGLDNVNILWGATVLQVGDEIFTVSGVDATAGTITIDSRGRFGTQAVPHSTGAAVTLYTFRPDGRFADEITSHDILDLRRSVTLGEWSYDSLLKHNLGKLLDGSLRSSYKQGSGTDTQGTQIIEVDTFLGASAGSLPNQTEQLDGFDGIRTIFSDSAVVQHDVSLLLTPSGGSVIPSTSDWGVAANFAVSGFIPSSGSAWVDGSVIRLWIGGASGSDGARKTSSTGDRFMRFVSPKEYWLSRDDLRTTGAGKSGQQTPFRMRFVGDSANGPQAWSSAAALGETFVPGAMFPLPEYLFMSPYAVLGGVVNDDLANTAATTVNGTPDEVRFPGVNFDTAGQWVADAADPQELSTTGITKLLLQGKRNLFDMLTDGGTNLTGASSELYLVLSDGTTDIGLFQVVGAGTIGYTTRNASTSDGVVVIPVGTSTITTGETLTAEIRSVYTNTEDGIGTSGTTTSSVAIVFTNIQATNGSTTNPWNGLSSLQIAGDMVLDTSILYGPSRGAMARLADSLSRFSVVNPAGVTLLREAPENKDPSPLDIRTRIGAPEDEYYFDAQPLMAWNRLPSLGLHAPFAADYGSGRYNFETRRDGELLVDRGSKTVLFRPLQQVLMSLPVRTAAADQIPSTYDGGVIPIDGAGLFGGVPRNIFDVPKEYMPRFGRQDIPIRKDAGTAGPFFGINHLFSDTSTSSDPTREIIGGTAAGLNLKIVTGTSSGLDYGAWSGPNNWYQGRLYTDVNARSTDINKPMRGIQLPPYLGIARVYGVYDKRDYDVNGSAWLDAGFTPDGGAAAGTNLLRTDADKQTLFIVQDGAADVIANSDAHTYVIPEEAIDITLSPDFVATETFDDLEYIVEVAVFGFAQGFINKHSYVLQRTGGTSTNLVSAIRMILPAALPGGVQGYSAYLRTVYQGDPFMTRDATTIQTADYENRYGQVPVASAFAVKTPLQQYDTDNAQIPEIPNPRSLEILATADFWTTLGTGKVGGQVFKGTVTDAGYLASPGSRIPESATSNPFQPEARAFSSGQPESAPYAGIGVEVIDHSSVSGTSISLVREDVTVTLTEGVEWTAGADAVADARALADAINSNPFLSLAGARSRYLTAVQAFAQGNVVYLQSRLLGETGSDTLVSVSDTAVYRLVAGTSYNVTHSRLPLQGGADVPANGARVASAPTPVGITGMTDRLPLGILVNDSDFLGEDPLRKGVAYEIRSGGGAQATTEVSTFAGLGQDPSARLHGSAGTMGMADGAVLAYTAYNAVSAPDGTRRFRIYRGGGSAYVLAPELGGGPVDFSAGGFSSGDHPVMKGAVLAGRAYLVRNGYEDAFGGTAVRSYGDEIQMVVVTTAVYGEGVDCEHGYVLDGIISPTDYGKGYSAADRFRLEGKPMVKSVAGLPDPAIPLIPYPPEDPADDDPCA